MKVAVLGVAFKNDTGDCRFTPAAVFIDRLGELGYQIAACDPLVSEADALKWFGMRLNASVPETIEGAHCIAILAGHSIFGLLSARDIAASAASGALVFDGRRFYSRAEINELESLGLRYKGVGRS